MNNKHIIQYFKDNPAFFTFMWGVMTVGLSYEQFIDDPGLYDTEVDPVLEENVYNDTFQLMKDGKLYCLEPDTDGYLNISCDVPSDFYLQKVDNCVHVMQIIRD